MEGSESKAGSLVTAMRREHLLKGFSSLNLDANCEFSGFSHQCPLKIASITLGTSLTFDVTETRGILSLQEGSVGKGVCSKT